MKFALEYGERIFGTKEAEETAAGRKVQNELAINWFS
jgi:hypothetical protein